MQAAVLCVLLLRACAVDGASSGEAQPEAPNQAAVPMPDAADPRGAWGVLLPAAAALGTLAALAGCFACYFLMDDDRDLGASLTHLSEIVNPDPTESGLDNVSQCTAHTIEVNSDQLEHL